MPFITIITSTLNALPLLRHTAASIWGQTYSDVQWIIVDGGSTDGTVEWLRKYCSVRPNCLYISEPDAGIYDAFNKALPLVKGEWVLFLGAGDSFYETTSMRKSARQLKDISNNISLAYGGVVLVETVSDAYGVLSYKTWAGVAGTWSGVQPQVPCHQGVFHRARLFACGFRFDTRFKIAADGELVIGEMLAARGCDMDMVVTKMLTGGVSSNRLAQLRMNYEMIRINIKLGIFWKRPLRQLVRLASNLVKHPFRVAMDRQSSRK